MKKIAKVLVSKLLGFECHLSQLLSCASLDKILNHSVPQPPHYILEIKLFICLKGTL